MKARVLILSVCVFLISLAALAHGGEEHVIGVVSKITAEAITVKTTAGKMVTVSVAPESKFIKSKAGAKIGDLNVGDRVVIHAKEPEEGKLVADTVEFGASPSAQATKQPTNK